MSKKVVRGFLRSDGKPNFSTAVFNKSGELEYLIHKPVHSSTSRYPIIKGIDIMITNGVRRLPITDSKNQLVGIVTATDIVDFLGGGDRHNIVKSKHKGRFFSAINEPLESIMTRDVIYAETCESFAGVLEKMIKGNKGTVPVVKKPMELVGIITEMDVVRYLSGRSLNQKVSEFMTRNVVFASPDLSISSAAKLMVSNGFRRIPLKSGDAVVGIVTTMDIVHYIGGGSAFRKILLDEMNQVLSTPVREIMRTGVVSVDIALPLGEAALLIRSSGVGAVLVRDCGEPVGILTERDLLTALVTS